jgi:hypothetical protein
MRTLSLKVILALLVLGAASFAPLSGTTTNAQDKSFVGYISDSHCGLKHMKGMGDDKACTLMCVKGGSKFVLADSDHKRVYRLDRSGQDKARDFAGQKVKVTGRIVGKTIRVTAIEAAT